VDLTWCYSLVKSKKRMPVNRINKSQSNKVTRNFWKKARCCGLFFGRNKNVTWGIFGDLIGDGAGILIMPLKYPELPPSVMTLFVNLKKEFV